MIKRKGYLCGPTVHNTPHLGNLKTFYHCIKHFKNQVGGLLTINITDIGQSIYEKADELKLSKEIIINFYTRKFIRILKLLGLKPHTLDFHRASFHLKQIKKDINKLLLNTNWSFKMDQTGIRGVPHSNYKNWMEPDTKSDLKDESRRQDFYIWRSNTSYDYFNFHFNGKNLPGIPGWHNECATLVNKFLEKDFVHYGSIDLKEIHHKNQCCLFNSFNSKNVTWHYIQPILVGKDKISKSLKNYTPLVNQKPRGWTLIQKWLKIKSPSTKTNFDTTEFENFGKVTLPVNFTSNRKNKKLKKLILVREKLKKKGLYELADCIREDLKSQGFTLRDQGKSKLYLQRNFIMENYGV